MCLLANYAKECSKLNKAVEILSCNKSLFLVRPSLLLPNYFSEYRNNSFPLRSPNVCSIPSNPRRLSTSLLVSIRIFAKLMLYFQLAPGSFNLLTLSNGGNTAKRPDMTSIIIGTWRYFHRWRAVSGRWFWLLEASHQHNSASFGTAYSS